MFELTRRGFLRVSSGAFGASLFGGLSPAAFVGWVADHHPPAKVFTVFFNIAPSTDDTDVRPLRNEEIVTRLARECPGVDFVVRDVTRGDRLQTILNEAKDLEAGGYDGVIVYGWPRDYDLLRTGLPTINVSIVNDFMNNPIPLYKEHRVVSAFLDPWGFSADSEIPERMFTDLADKIKLIRMLKRMKSEHILTVTDSDYVNVTYGDVLKHMPADYNERIKGAIDDTFGVSITKIGTKEVTADKDIQSLWREESDEAEKIANRWIGNAEKVINTLESEVVRSAKVYLAM